MAAMKTQRDEKTVDLAQLLLDLDLQASTSLQGLDQDFHVCVTIEVDEDGVRVRMVDHHGRRVVPPFQTSFPFSKRLRWTRQRQNDDIQGQMRSLDPRSLLFLRFIRQLRLKNDALGEKRGGITWWSRNVDLHPVQHGLVEIRSITNSGWHGPKAGVRVENTNSQHSNYNGQFHVVEEPTLESGPVNRLIMAFPVCQYEVGQWTKDEHTFSFAYKKPCPFKFLMHVDRWGGPDHTKSSYRIHQDHQITDFHARAMAKGFKKLSEIPSLRYTWMQYLPSMDVLKQYDELQGGGVCATLPRWLSLLPILETEMDTDRNQLQAITDLCLEIQKELDPKNEPLRLVPDVENALLSFSGSQSPELRPPSPRRTRRRSNNLVTTADTVPTPTTISVPLSTKYLRSDLATLLSDYALNLLPEKIITFHLQSLLNESRSPTWYAKFFFLRSQHEDFHSRIARLFSLVYTKQLEHPDFRTCHHDEWRKIIESVSFIPLSSGALLSPRELKSLGTVYAPVDDREWPLAGPGMDLQQLTIQVLHPGAWRNQDCKKLLGTVGWVKIMGNKERMKMVAEVVEKERPLGNFGGGFPSVMFALVVRGAEVDPLFRGFKFT
ncbi:hypothetical protein B0T21DRAFT_159947 [Apiosordaria backusii]|uniref:Uncharacterized protein n=1 Tax=Apiosordaria backusii TaxID=314023 RepID=A0AA40BN39_9PEZI|nr:hypothetical protein B0T21DRAFT_159947 [Apiosordaria backusii]